MPLNRREVEATLRDDLRALGRPLVDLPLLASGVTPPALYDLADHPKLRHSAARVEPVDGDQRALTSKRMGSRSERRRQWEHLRGEPDRALERLSLERCR